LLVTAYLSHKTTEAGAFSTKYVLGSEVHNWSLNKESASYTLLLTDAHNYVEMEVSSANVLTIPTNATVAFPIGTEIRVTQLGTGQTTITPDAGVTLRSISGKDKTTGQYSVATLFKRGLNEWYLFGDITT
jgi:hypothetical protein